MYKIILKIILGLILIISVLVAYIPEPEYLVELTCASNTFGGLLLIIDGILNLKRKKGIPVILYLVACVSLLLVFIVCMISLSGVFKFNFKGAFFFLHIINPIAFLICYFLFVNESKRRVMWVFFAPTFVIIYLLFDYILGNIRGYFVYGFVAVNELTIFYAFITGLITYVLLCLIGFGIFYLNRLIYKITPH